MRAHATLTSNNPSCPRPPAPLCAQDFHPEHSHIFLFCTSRGSIKLGDMREAALCDRQAKVFEEEEDPASKSYFSEIIASVSDAEFSRDGRLIVARDVRSLAQKAARACARAHAHAQRRASLWPSSLACHFSPCACAATLTAPSAQYLTVKVWDVAMEGRGPVCVVPVHDQL